ncbi:outer membrane beta-barrel protein [Undibacterium sp. TC4M20W]|uniref:outer membrane beta-barrel protein n=1 Tax=Undibacterium sp. TC4M20W TaxID=3413052 RepID=UPI003BF2D350
MKKILLACAVSLPMIACAQADQKPLRLALSMGLSAGGDTITTVSYTDGTRSNVSAGTGLILSAGADYRYNQYFSGQANIGYHARFTPEASNGDATFSRIPVELLGYYHINEQWRVGAGARFNRNVKLSGSGAGSQYNRSFNNSNGAILEAEYLFNPQWSVKVRAVKEEFETTYGKQKFSGNHFGLIGSFYY